MYNPNNKIILDIIETTGKEKKLGKYKITSKVLRKPVYCDDLKVLDYK